jgi:hypothetical protein
MWKTMIIKQNQTKTNKTTTTTTTTTNNNNNNNNNNEKKKKKRQRFLPQRRLHQLETHRLHQSAS